MEDPQPLASAIHDAIVDILVATAACGASQASDALRRDLPMLAPRLAHLATSDDLVIAIVHATNPRRVTDVRRLLASPEASADCGIATLGPLLWTLLHLVAQSRRIAHAGLLRGRHIFAVLLARLPDYFPEGCSCRQNLKRRMPAIQRYFQNNPSVGVSVLDYSIALHCDINVELDSPPYGDLGSYKEARKFWLIAGGMAPGAVR